MRTHVLGLPAGVVPVTYVHPGEEGDGPVSKDVMLALMKAIEEDFRDRSDYPSKPPAIET